MDLHDGNPPACFLAAVAGDRLEALYAVQLTLGLRPSEVLGLTWDDGPDLLGSRADQGGVVGNGRLRSCQDAMASKLLYERVPWFGDVESHRRQSREIRFAE